MRGGQRTRTSPSLDASREAFRADLGGLPAAAQRIRGPFAPRATFSERLSALAVDVRRRIEDRTAAASVRSSERSSAPERIAAQRSAGGRAAHLTDGL